MSAKRIENDEAYERSLNWLVSKSIELENPLIAPEEKAKQMRAYDYVAEAAQRYRRGKLVQEYPNLRTRYEELGWAFDELGTAPEQTLPVAPEPKPEPTATEKPQQPKPAAALAGWLDDD